jgi:hypothetical protein
MAFAFTVAGAKTGDSIQLSAQSPSNGTFHSVLTLADDYAIDGCILQ